MAPNEQCIFPISEISAYVQRWTIRARVTSKSQLRTFAKGNGNGKVFHVHLLDASGGEIRASFFNDAADGNFERLQLGKCYTLSRGSARIANQQYNACHHRYELVFDKAAQIEEAEEDEQIESVKLFPVDLRSVQTRALPCTIDICGVVASAGPAVSFTSKEGRDLVKREVTVADDSGASLAVAIWGERARKEDSAFEGHPVVGLKAVVVKEWNGGRNGSLTEGGALVFDPKLPEAQRVQQWWSQGGQTQSLTSLSSTDGRARASAAAGAKPLDLVEMRKLSEKVLDQPELYSVVCRLAQVQLSKRGERQPLTYTACQELKEGKSLPCNRRVDSSGFCASCNRAGKAAPRFNLRCRFADFGDQAWLTTFHEASQQVVGMTADTAQELERGDGGREELEAAIARKSFNQPLQLVVRAKLDTYNGETRTNITCIDARPVKRGERGRFMLKEIQDGLQKGVLPVSQ